MKINIQQNTRHVLRPIGDVYETVTINNDNSATVIEVYRHHHCSVMSTLTRCHMAHTLMSDPDRVIGAIVRRPSAAALASHKVAKSFTTEQKTRMV